MKNKNFIMVILLLLSISFVNAEEVLWNNSLGYDSCDTYSYSIIMDDSGNVYVTGYIYNYTDSSESIITIKYDSDGNILWNKTYDSVSRSDGTRFIALDGSGNICVVGTKANDFLTVKYDADGTELWNKTFDSSSNIDYATAVGVDGSGNIYVSGYGYNGDDMDILIVKYAPNGTHLWDKCFNYDSNYDYGYDMAVDSSGNAYIVGTGYKSGYTDIITLKYDPDGNLNWSKYFDYSSNHDTARYVDVDDSGYVYVIGRGRDAEDYDIITIKYAPNGTEIWSNIAGSDTLDDTDKDVIVDSTGNVYSAFLDYTSGGHIVKYDADGNELWNIAFGTGKNYIYSLYIDSDDMLYATGDTSGGDILTVKYDADGNELWNNSFDYMSDYDSSSGVISDNLGNTYAIGSGRNLDSFDELLLLKYGSSADTTAPVVIINTLSQAYNYNSSILNVTVTDTTPVTVIANITDQGMNITLNKTADGYFVNPDFEFIDGVHNVTIIATDAMGNVNSTETVNFMVDTTGPEFTIVSPINNTVYTINRFMVNITAEDPSGMDKITSDLDEWVVTLGEYPAYYYCYYTGILDGNHTLIFTATDNLGNTAVKTIYVAVDTQPPEITINYPINGSYNTTEMIINATATDLSGIKNATAEINGINYTISENGTYYTLNKTLTEGDYVLKVYASDNNNDTNVSSIVAFRVDTTAPEVTIATPIDGANVTVSNPTLNFTTTDNLCITTDYDILVDGVSLDSGNSSNASAVTYSLTLTNGTHTITVVAIDSALNSANDSITVVVDTAAPTAEIMSPLNDDFTNDTTPEVTFNLTDNLSTTLSYKVYVNGSVDKIGIALNSTLTSVNLSALSEGVHEIIVESTDAHGFKTNSTSVNITVDGTAPAFNIFIEDGAYFNNGSNVLNFTVNELYLDTVSALNGSTEILLNNSTGNYLNSAELADGVYNVIMYANDTASNENSTYVRFTVDTVNPEVTVNTVNESSYKYNTSILNVTVTDINLDSVVAEINGLTNITLTENDGYFVNSTFEFDETLNTVRIYATDLAGNVNSSETVNFRVDLTDPVITVNTESGAYFNNGSNVLNFTVNELYLDTVSAFNGSTEILLNNSTGDYLNSAELADGVYNVTITANDTASNENSTYVSFTVDTVNPEVTVNSPANGTTFTTNSAVINVTANDSLSGISSVIAEIEGVGNVNLTLNGNYYTGNTGTLSNGNYEITILATDLAGNVNSTESVIITITVPRSSGGGGGSSYSSDLSNGITSSVLRNTVSNSNVVYGSEIDRKYAEELRENLQNGNNYEIDRDTIIVGGPNANGLANQYNGEFEVPISNDYPGENRGVIQVKNIEVMEGNIIKTYQVIYIAGSDRLGTQAALEYFKTLDELPEGPITVKWTANGPVLVE
ncbi:hypothetical protein HNP89_001940 [Methanococcus maripaludis]|uniref:Bulb-type lectin domain-containing protein n=1 Tax=Methanococcus maripaludis TaxID=39152 RepID=A0A7J9P209_METMI|nr:Ig-like domain-containing protein [Methanococcus maripaludis]MBA2853962.1 hypothetical protein [Methanococcus maripaludis]